MSDSWSVGTTEALTLIFVTLKLTHFIDWSWWWVLSPVVTGFAVFMVAGFISGLVKELTKR